LYIKYGQISSVFAYRIMLLICLLMTPIFGLAQDFEPPNTHWAFSAFIGTGWYKISDNRSVFVFRVPPRQVVRKSSFDELGKRKIGFEVHYPLTMGLNNVEDIGGVIKPDNFGTIAFTPGLELEIPVTSKWYLRPFAHVGWGKETDGGTSAWIYYGGVKSRYTPGNSKVDWSVLNAVYYAGYSPKKGVSDSLVSAMMGVEFRQAISWGEAWGDDLNLDWHVTYTRLVDRARFASPAQFGQSIDDQWELGLALRRSNKPLKIWFVDFEHVGLSFKSSSNGEFRAISVNLRSPFTK
jgi:hypothetical protein